ncbi:glycosyltransferase [Vibrio vulnificus]
MRILIVIPTLRPGGAESTVLALANSLSNLNQNDEIFVITIFHDEFSKSFINHIDPRIKYLGLDLDISQKLKAVFKLFFLVKQLKPHVIHTHLTALYYSSLPSLLLGINHIHTVHTQPRVEFYGARKILFKVISAFTNKLQLVSLSREHKEVLSSSFNNEVTIISNGARKIPSNYKSVNNNFVILARFDPVKQHDLLIKAFLKASFNHDVKLKIVGSIVPEYLDYFNKIQKLIDNENNIEMYTNVTSNSQLSEIFSKCQFIVLSSKFEGLPVSLLEGMSAGLIPVGIPTPGLKEFFLFNNLIHIAQEPSVHGLSLCITDCFKMTYEAIEKESCASKNIFNNMYSSDVMAESYSRLYQKVCEL